jgi:hypothetical protein
LNVRGWPVAAITGAVHIRAASPPHSGQAAGAPASVWWRWASKLPQLGQL